MQQLVKKDTVNALNINLLKYEILSFLKKKALCFSFFLYISTFD